MGEKTGWTYVEVPAAVSQKIKPGCKKSYRVKGRLDEHPINGVSLLPMGEGDFIMPLNANMRKGIKKKKGEKLTLELEEDKAEKMLNTDLLVCLADAPEAEELFLRMPGSHQRYYSNWVEQAKTDETRMKRITKIIYGLPRGLSFGEIMKLKE